MPSAIFAFPRRAQTFRAGNPGLRAVPGTPLRPADVTAEETRKLPTALYTGRSLDTAVGRPRGARGPSVDHRTTHAVPLPLEQKHHSHTCAGPARDARLRSPLPEWVHSPSTMSKEPRPRARSNVSQRPLKYRDSAAKGGPVVLSRLTSEAPAVEELRYPLPKAIRSNHPRLPPNPRAQKIAAFRPGRKKSAELPLGLIGEMLMGDCFGVFFFVSG